MNQNLNTITESIIGCAYTVANILGHGFIEKIHVFTPEERSEITEILQMK